MSIPRFAPATRLARRTIQRRPAGTLSFVTLAVAPGKTRVDSILTGFQADQMIAVNARHLREPRRRRSAARRPTRWDESSIRRGSTDVPERGWRRRSCRPRDATTQAKRKLVRSQRPSLGTADTTLVP